MYGTEPGAVLPFGLDGRSGMSTQDRDTADGAGVGAAGGAVLTGGSAVETIGGAAVSGIVGHEVGKDKKQAQPVKKAGRSVSKRRMCASAQIAPGVQLIIQASIRTGRGGPRAPAGSDIDRW